jgi:hypothetical protein
MKLSGGTQMYLELFLFEGAAVVWGLWQLWQVRPNRKEKDAETSEPITSDKTPSDS